MADVVSSPMKRSTRALRVIDVIAAIFAIYGLLTITPLSWWGYRAGILVVEDVEVGQPIQIMYDRDIWREIMITYSVVIRNWGGRIVCEDDIGPPFRYKKNSGTLRWSLDEWAPQDTRCEAFDEPGFYHMETCWYAPLLLGGLLPPKQTCREASFTVREPAIKIEIVPRAEDGRQHQQDRRTDQ